MSNLHDQITALTQKTVYELEKARAQSEAIQKTHNLLRDFVFQAVTNVKATEQERKLEVLANALREINKSSDQELQRYVSNLSSLSGQIQGLQQALEVIKSQETDDPSEEI